LGTNLAEPRNGLDFKRERPETMTGKQQKKGWTTTSTYSGYVLKIVKLLLSFIYYFDFEVERK
jgi:hypothetical protein